jgi:hypothetical protein
MTVGEVGEDSSSFLRGVPSDEQLISQMILEGKVRSYSWSFYRIRKLKGRHQRSRYHAEESVSDFRSNRRRFSPVWIRRAVRGYTDSRTFQRIVRGQKRERMVSSSTSIKSAVQD